MKKLIIIFSLSFTFVLSAWMPPAFPMESRESGCLTWRLQQQTGDLMPWDMDTSRELPCDYTPVGPPLNPQVGDEWDWYIWSLNGYPEAELMPCTVRGSSEHAYVVVENSQWNVNINQADVDAILEYFENQSLGAFPDQGIWDLNTAAFGEPPDELDQDGKVYLLYYEFDVSADGYFWIFDQACDGTQNFASNECDVIYLNSGIYSPSGDYMLAVAAHEFEHLIHHARDANEASWVDEGCGELAMWLFGAPDNISGFNNHPDRTLTDFTGEWADYIKTYLWMLYFYEQFGGITAVYELVNDTANGIQGFENFWTSHSYDVDFKDVFADWTVANFLDDPTLLDGRFGYVGDDLPPFSTFAQHSEYPVNQQNAAVNHWAADYASFTDGLGLSVEFDGADDAGFAVWALELDDAGITRVSAMHLNQNQEGNMELPDFGHIFEEIVMVFAGTSSSGSKNYSYAANETTPLPTPAPTPTPTSSGQEPSINLELNKQQYTDDDPFILNATFKNPFEQSAHLQVFILLAVYQDYWCWPSWIYIEDGIDFGDRRIPAETQTQENILDFIWPQNAGQAQNICFLAAVLDYETGVLFSDIDQVCFDFY